MGGASYDPSQIVSSNRSRVQRSDAFKSAMHNYASVELDSGALSALRNIDHTPQQLAAIDRASYLSPGVSRLPAVHGAQQLLEMGPLPVRTSKNRSNLHQSMDRMGAIGAPSSRQANYFL